MKNRIQAVLTCGTVLAIALLPVNASADITYMFIDGAAGDQNGHTLSGTITFDSVCGTSCSASNVTDFSFSVSGPNNFSYSFQPANGDVLINGSALNVAADGLYFDFDSVSYAEFTLRDGSFVGPQLIWQAGGGDLYRGFVEYNFGSSVKAWDDNSPTSGVVKIASVVPEPSSLALLGLGGLLIARRHRR